MNNTGIQDVIGTDIIDTSTKVLREHINKKLCRNISCVIQSFCYINTNVQPILATIVAQIDSGTLSPIANTSSLFFKKMSLHIEFCHSIKAETS